MQNILAFIAGCGLTYWVTWRQVRILERAILNLAARPAVQCRAAGEMRAVVAPPQAEPGSTLCRPVGVR